MKKFAPIVAIAVLGVMFTSCKKKNDCVCTDSAGTEISRTDLSSFSSTKSALCSTTSTAFALTYSGGSCKLK